MFARKIPQSMVQFAFCYAAVLELDAFGIDTDRCSTILSAGSYEDITTECLKTRNFDVVGVDPVLNCDLHTYTQGNSYLYDFVVSASVLEHVENDEEFIADSCNLLLPGGYGVFTMDFKNDWTPGQRVPTTSRRFYTAHDLTVRLPGILSTCNCALVDTPDYSAVDSFSWEGIQYSFASFVFRKKQ